METNKTHYTEADLLETYYTKPGQSMPVMMHLASCQECASRYERLERKLREAAACPAEKPDSFWARQRISIMRRVHSVRRPQVRNLGPARIAAAAVLAFLLGGALVFEVTRAERGSAPATIARTAPSSTKGAEDLQLPRDPWQSDELQEFQPIVQWESWVSEGL